MSNIKAVEIAGELPYHWAQDLEALEAQMVASLFLNPAIGVHISWGAVTWEPNKQGGMTAWHEFTVRGEEALRYETLKALTDIFVKHGRVTAAVARDVEQGGPWREIR